MYKAYFAVLNLIYYIHEGADSELQDSVASDTFRGRNALALYGKESLAADRCAQSIDVFTPSRAN